MENFNGFNIDHLLWMLDAALTRQNEKHKAAVSKITEKVRWLCKLCDILAFCHFSFQLTVLFEHCEIS